MEIKDQVQFKEKLFNGNRIRFGHIVSFKDEEKTIAVVSVSDDVRKPMRLMASCKKEIPIAQLELVKKLYGGRTSIQANPLRRSIGNLINR